MTCKAIMKKEKNKKRGRNKISAKLRRKQKNVVDAQTIKLKVRGDSVINLSVRYFYRLLLLRLGHVILYM